MGGKSITFRYLVYREPDGTADGALAAEGSVVCAVVDLGKFVAVHAPERVEAMLADLVEAG